MIDKTGIIVFCTHELGHNALAFLHQKKLLKGVVIDQKPSTSNARISRLSNRENIPLWRYEKNQNSKMFAKWIRTLQPRHILCINFGYRIPEQLLNDIGQPIYNFHPGKLPENRGADPLFWQIRNNLKGCISVHKVTPRFDDGAIYVAHEVASSSAETYWSLLYKMIREMPTAVEKLLHKLEASERPLAITQNEKYACYFERPQAHHIGIDWGRHSAREIFAMVRASQPQFLGASTSYRGHLLYISRASLNESLSQNSGHLDTPGSLAIDYENEALYVLSQCGHQLKIEQCWYQEKFWDIKEFIRYFRPDGERFGAETNTSLFNEINSRIDPNTQTAQSSSRQYGSAS